MKYENRWTKLVVVLLIGVLTATVAVAQSPLTQPKADGLIGEQANGYIGLVTNNVPPEIRRLVDDVNAKRKAGYQRIAAQQGVSLRDVERIGGKEAIEKTRRGNYIKDDSGAWRKK